MRLTLKIVQPNSISKTHFAIRFNLLYFWPPVLSFVFAVLLKCSFTVLRGYFYISPNVMAISHAYIWLNIRDTVPLITQWNLSFSNQKSFLSDLLPSFPHCSLQFYSGFLEAIFVLSEA